METIYMNEKCFASKVCHEMLNLVLEIRSYLNKSRCRLANSGTS